MNEEMLQDDVVESVDEQQVEDSQQATESAEVAPKNDDFVELTPEVRKRVNKLTWEKNEAIRKAKALEEKLSAKPQAAQDAQPSAPSDVQAPDVDLSYSDPEAYRQQMNEWQINVRKQAEEAARAAARSIVDETKTRAQQEAQQAKQQEAISGYSQRAIESGLNADKLIQAESVVTAYNPSPELADFILSDQNGPHLMSYLADNQPELEALVSMSPMRAALKLEQIRSKALNANKGTKAPDPVEPLGGRSTVDNESPLIKGATFS